MAKEKKTQLHLVDLAEIGNLLEDLIVKDIITCEERDRIIQRIMIFLIISFPFLRDISAAKIRYWSELLIEIQLQHSTANQMKVIFL